MNDNEKLSLAKALTANSRRMMELVEANNALVESLVRSLEQSQAVTAIDWSDAPDWAQYTAQDEDGSWWWYQEVPYIAGDDTMWNNRGGKWDRATWGECSPNPNWRNTLQARPQSEPVASGVRWDLIPAMYNWIAKDKNIGWFAYKNRPRQSDTTWGNDGPCDEIDPDDYNIPDIDWRESLMQRPVQNEAAVLEERPSDKFAVNWSDVPAWAQWVAQDENGAVWAYELRPVMEDTVWFPDRTSGARATPIPRGKANPLWKKTLTQRPQPAVWDNAPEWANWLAMDKDGRWFWFSDEPECHMRVWVHGEDGGIHQHYKGCPLVASDWTKSLQKRPR